MDLKIRSFSDARPTIHGRPYFPGHISPRVPSRNSKPWKAVKTEVKGITGKVNGWKFRGFPAGQVLFHGARGSASSKDPALIEITFSFEQSDDVQSQTIGDITGIEKPGWAYLWVRHTEQKDTTAGRLVRRPEAVYVERVYYAANFNQLGIGS